MRRITPFAHIAILLAFLVNTFGPLPQAEAQEFLLPAPGVMVRLSHEFNPPILKGIKVHPDNPFRFDFILDKGDSSLANEQLKEESSKLIKYFLASLTIPEKDLWVNLSPYEKDRIVPESFGITEMGRDLLAEDYMLKQITASLIYPEDEVGKKFWKRVYEEEKTKYGTTNIPVNTFNKVWIVPEKAVVYENAKAGTAYVVESKLKVMLEQDYLSLEKHEGIQTETSQSNDTNKLGSQIVREIVIPELTKEVNEGKNFSQLRQVYNSLILATWYKKKIKDSILSQVYSDKSKTAGINIDDPQEKERIYQQYLQAFKKGVYNYIKEDIDPSTQQSIPRKYFSGGFDLAMAVKLETTDQIDSAQLADSDNLRIVSSYFDAAMQINLPKKTEDDIVLAGKTFMNLIQAGESKWKDFKQEIGEAQEYTQPKKVIAYGKNKFVLVRKRSGGGVVFTLDQNDFKELALLKGWRFKESLPDVDNNNDIVFSVLGFLDILRNGTARWAEIKALIGDAKEWPAKTKTIEINGQEFILIKKRSGVATVFTLKQEEFKKLVILKEWDLKEELNRVSNEDVVFSGPSLRDLLDNAQQRWSDFKAVVGNAKEWPESTKVIDIKGQKFVLIRKRLATAIVFTMNQEQFKKLAILQGWKFKEELPSISSEDVVFSSDAFTDVLQNGRDGWNEIKFEIGDAKEWEQPTKIISFKSKDFILTRKLSGVTCPY